MMKSTHTVLNRIYAGVYILILILIFIGIPVVGKVKNINQEEATNFSDNWNMGSGKLVFVDDINIKDFDGKAAIEKKVPLNVTDRDSLCFASQNVNLKVFINGREVYRFNAQPNLTGIGYGVAFHDIGLTREDEGKVLRIEYTKVYPKLNRARVFDINLCPASVYFHKVIRRSIVPFVMSILTIFIGLVFVVTYFGAVNKKIFPFDILALGASAIVIGVWLLIETNVIQMVTGHIYICRDISRTLLFMLAYTAICFVNSETEQKKHVYNHIGFCISVFLVLGIITLRYVFNVDMLRSFSIFAIAYLLLLLITCTVLTVDNKLYCRRNGIPDKLNTLSLSGLIFIAGGVLDVVSYLIYGRMSDMTGTFSRIGVALYSLIMLIEFLRWWMKDHADVEKDRFINRALQYALSSNSPDDSIRALLGYLGKEFEAKRIFIFEDQKNGKYRGTYEWYSEDTESSSLDMMYLPAQDYVDKLYEEFNKNDHRLIIQNPEVYRFSIPAFYNLLKSNSVENIIIAPMEVSGNLFGVCGVVGAPKKRLESISELINLITYFIAQMVLQREEQARAFYYNYNDVLSGAGNYTAFRKYLEEDLDKSSPFGYMCCDLIGLDEINITQGYDVGDQIVVVAAKCLMEVFGEASVFRVNGVRFSVFGFETEETFFYNDVERVKKLIKENGIEAEIASVYCVYGTNDMGVVMKKVDDLIQKGKTT